MIPQDRLKPHLCAYTQTRDGMPIAPHTFLPDPGTPNALFCDLHSLAGGELLKRAKWKRLHERAKAKRQGQG